MIYLASRHSTALSELAQTASVGLIVQPANSAARHVGGYRFWAADNGCYAAGDRFDAAAWLLWLDSLPREQCLFATAPDVVGDAVATLQRSAYLSLIRRLGFPAAFVAQDGAEDLDLPWVMIDVLFIGGTTRWKLDRAARVASQAHERSVPVHMGRVNSLRRLRAAELMGCRSADGTYVGFRARLSADLGEREVGGWLAELERAPLLPLTPS